MQKIQQLEYLNFDPLGAAIELNKEFTDYINTKIKSFENISKTWKIDTNKVLAVLINTNKTEDIKILIKLTKYIINFDYEIRIAALNGNFELVEYFFKKGGNINNALYTADQKIKNFALSNGAIYDKNSKIIDFISKYSDNLPLELDNDITLNDILYGSAYLNNLNLLNKILYNYNIPINIAAKIIKKAALDTGNDVLFNWALTKDNNVDKMLYNLLIKYDKCDIIKSSNMVNQNLIADAAINGSLDIIKYFYNGKNFDEIAIIAASSNKLNVVLWCLENGAKNYNDLIIQSIVHNNIGIIDAVSKYIKVNYYDIINFSKIPNVIIFSCKKYLLSDKKRYMLYDSIRKNTFNFSLNDFTLEEINVSLYYSVKYDRINFVKSLFILNQHLAIVLLLANFYKSNNILKWLKNTYKIFG